MLKKIASITQAFCFPAFCPLCLRESTPHRLCDDCCRFLPLIDKACIQCGSPLPIKMICGSCLKKPPAFDKSIIPFAYQDEIKTLIHHFKFFAALELGPLLANLMHYTLQQAYKDNSLPECLIAMPLHNNRLRWRGYNQSLLLAHNLASVFNLKVEKSLCRRQKNTSPQMALNAKARRKNVNNAFSVTNKISYEHIAIIDDVMTTGATANALAKAFKKQGVKQVDVWCVAKSIGL